MRFGVPGRYVFRQVHDKINCTVRDFGNDPAVGQTKSCERSVNWRQDPAYQGWRQPGSSPATGALRQEGDWCDAPSGAEVRFGIDGQFATKRERRRALRGWPSLEIRPTSAARSARWPTRASGRNCANEGQYCSATGTVRYIGQWPLTGAPKGGIACNNGSFGDPYPGVAKQCEVRTTRAGAPARAGRGEGSDQLGWRACAREGETCSFKGAGVVRYGLDGRYTYREAVNGPQLPQRSVGGPGPRQTKSCGAATKKRR